MLKTERQAQILRLIRQHGFIHTDEIAATLRVSTVTIRRDIKELDQQSLIKVEHGGATSVGYLEAVPEPIFETKMQMNALQKQAIGLKVVAFIEDGDTIIIDAGTTCLQIARNLKAAKFNQLTVITNDIVSARELSPIANITIILLGGILCFQYYNSYGPFAESTLSNLRANKFFFAFDGFTPDRGFSSTFLGEVPLKQKMLDISSRIIAVSDSSKIGVDALYTICEPQRVHALITDSGVGVKNADTIASMGIDTTIVNL